MDTLPPLHGRALSLPLSLAVRVARTFVQHPFTCIARSDDGRPLILAHDLDDQRQLLARMGDGADDTIAVHAGQYVDGDGQVILPCKGHYILLAGRRIMTTRTPVQPYDNELPGRGVTS